MDVSNNAFLQEVKRTRAYHNKQKDDSYNIFRVLGVFQTEVVMCRMLADLLNPDGSHGRKEVYLKSFMEQVLKRKLPDEELKTVHVYVEYPIPGRKRIDLVIRGQSCFIPIEVKMEAPDQNNQCYDYYQYACRMDENTQMVYLTRNGDYPAEYSLCSADGKDMLPEDKLLCISFSKDITGWLEEILSKETGSMKPVLQQYLDAICEFTADENELLYQEIAEISLASECSLRTALDIGNSVHTIKVKLVNYVMKELETQMERLNDELEFERENRFHYWEYPAHEYGGINYVIKQAVLTKGRELWLRIDFDDREGTLYAGLCVFDTKAEGEDGLGCEVDCIDKKLERELRQYITPQVENSYAWWYTWWYLPTGSNSLQADRKYIPNFISMNEAAIRLADEKKRRVFAEECVSMIKEKLVKIKKS